MSPTISVVIPVHQASALLDDCLSHLMAGTEQPTQCIVVDDGSTDDSAQTALDHGAVVISTDRRRGPAHARNLGARAARGDVVLFLDADVRPAADTVRRVRESFAEDGSLDALIGSYDDDPSSPGFASQYKNLMHCFVHQSANRSASTFWSGCGAMRREVFLAVGGFDETYDRPAIEDIELGYRVVAAGRKISLDPKLTVKHLKHWTLPGLIRCDIFYRALPWTELIWRDRLMPNDLNLRTSQRVSVALVGLLMVASVFGVVAALAASSVSTAEALALGTFGVWCVGTTAIIALNRRFFRFLAHKRGLAFALGAVPMQVAYYLYSGFAFALGTARYAAGRVQTRSEIVPLEPTEERVAEIA